MKTEKMIDLKTAYIQLIDDDFITELNKTDLSCYEPVLLRIFDEIAYHVGVPPDMLDGIDK